MWRTKTKNNPDYSESGRTKKNWQQKMLGLALAGERESANDDQVSDMRFHLEKFNLNGKLL